jgi:hypothetical protein
VRAGVYIIKWLNTMGSHERVISSFFAAEEAAAAIAADMPSLGGREEYV